MLFRVPLSALYLTAALCVIPVLRISAEPAGSAQDPLGSHVRGTTPAVEELIARGASRSPTFKKLIEDLNASDVIVYLEQTRALPPGLDGRLTFMTAAGGVRYVRAQVITGIGFEQLIAVAGHELQHALEIAAHSEVRDSASLAGLYERIGILSPIKNRYDTAAAQSTGRRVRAELS